MRRSLGESLTAALRPRERSSRASPRRGTIRGRLSDGTSSVTCAYRSHSSCLSGDSSTSRWRSAARNRMRLHSPSSLPGVALKCCPVVRESCSPRKKFRRRTTDCTRCKLSPPPSQGRPRHHLLTQFPAPTFACGHHCERRGGGNLRQLPATLQRCTLAPALCGRRKRGNDPQFGPPAGARDFRLSRATVIGIR